MNTQDTYDLVKELVKRDKTLLFFLMGYYAHTITKDEYLRKIVLERLEETNV
jgi:hypothetical protein